MISLCILLLSPLIAGGICFLLSNRRAQYFVSLGIAALHFGYTLFLFLSAEKAELPFFFGFDSLNMLFLLILSHVYFWVILVSHSFLQRHDSGKAEEGKKYYFVLMNFYLLANSAALLSNHFGMYWVAAEATTLSAAPLVYYYRTAEALEAMWKYLFIVSVGIAFAFIGILFLTLSAQNTALAGEQLLFSEFIQNAGLLNPVYIQAAFIFLFVGLSTKIGIAPVHLGDVDATSNAPAPAAALLSASLRLTALLGVLRIFQIAIPTAAYEFTKIVFITGGILSVFAAFVYMFKANNFKRMLAYSSVEHLGLIALGIGTGGIAFIAAFYHILYNSLIKSAVFFTAGNIHYRYKTRSTDTIRGVLTALPWTGWIFLISFLALSGIPPFGFFFSELLLFEGLLFSPNPYLLFILLFFLFFLFVTMGRTFFSMLYGKPDNEASVPESFTITHFAAAALLFLSAGIALFAPQSIQSIINNIARDFGVIL